MSKAASVGQLSELHNKVANVLNKALGNLERAQDAFEQMTPEQVVETGAVQPEVNPTLLGVAVRFLDANKITCAPEDSQTMQDLEKKLEQRRALRAGRRVGNVEFLETGTD